MELKSNVKMKKKEVQKRQSAETTSIVDDTMI